MAIGAHRKVVSVVFCDVVGSTALGESVDPEALQALLARYFERMKAIVESHGGTVEKFIGDAVMAVFGVPLTHEDDALRACRAAVEMRDALPELGIAGRIGVNTGEVLAGTEERLATGDAVNVAARLEQAAQPGEILIGAETLALVGEAVELGEKQLLELKGKSEPVAAHPLLEIRESAERAHTSRFVGRQGELQQLADAWDRALAGPCCEVVTVVGDPGVGKSRLVAESLARIDARVARGRCLSYGEGITYWPVVEVVKQLDTLPRDELAANAIRSLLRESDAIAGTDEIAWAFRKLLEEQAPLVVCFDDIHWGEETFLDLVEATHLLSTDASILLVCMARPELLDRRPGWPAALRLEPLPAEQAEELVGEAVTDEVRERIVRASGGNPLFVTEMLALAGQRAEVEVPATLRALLAARLDQLEEPERRVLERGAVEGELFHRGAVQALAPEETEVTRRLAALVRRDLVRPDRPTLPSEDAFRFRHLLLRDAAYEALPKATRADLHRRFADWLEEHAHGLVELDETLGYHLEQAARYLDELGRPDVEVALAAGDRLAAAGRRALARGDRRSTAVLLGRSLSLTRPHRLDVHLELDLAWANEEDPAAAVEIASSAAERAAAAGDDVAATLAQVAVRLYGLARGTVRWEELEPIARRLLPRLEELGDHRGLVTVWLALAEVANWHARFDDRAEACEQAIRHSRLAGGKPTHATDLGYALVLGSRPAGDALRTLDELGLESDEPMLALSRAMLLAMLDRPEEARALATRAAEQLQEQGRPGGAAGERLSGLAVLAGDLPAAIEDLRSFCDYLEGVGRASELSTYAPQLGRFLCLVGRSEEAGPLAEKGRELGHPDDVSTQLAWRQAEALVCSARGEHARAELLAREAVDWAARADGLWPQGDAFCDLARVLEAAGHREEAVAAWQQALDRYERKQISPLARRVRERLAALQPA